MAAGVLNAPTTLHFMRLMRQCGGWIRVSLPRVLPAAAMLTVCGFLHGSVVHSQESRNVLALYSGAPDYPANELYERGLLRALRNNPRESPEYFAEYFEIDRFPGADHAAIFREYLRQKYSGQTIDVIVASAETTDCK